MGNLSIYNQVRTVPPNALKEIKGGRLSGKSDINPMWRIKTLTEQFGMCGTGWKYEILKQWLEEGGKGETAAFVNIHLYVKVGGEWSDAIPGTGGSMFIANEKSGLYTSDECYKMALTDAISVACKALGVGADVYWDKDATKYDKLAKPQLVPPKEPSKPKPPPKAAPINWPAFWAKVKELGFTEADAHFFAKADNIKGWNRDQLAGLIAVLKGVKEEREIAE